MSQIQGKWIEPGAITPSLLDATGAYSMGSLSVAGDATVGNGLRVDGTMSAEAISSEVMVYDRLAIVQDDDQEALTVEQISAIANTQVMQIDNAGTGASLIVNKSGTGAGIMGIGVVPTTALDVNGVALIRSDATVNGGFRVDGTMSAGAISSEVMVYDQLAVVQDDNQAALIVQQTNGAATAAMMQMTNNGTGSALTIVGTTPVVGIGTASPLAGQTLDVNGKVQIQDTLTCTKDATVSGGISTNQETTGTLTVTAGAGVGTDLQVGRDLQVTRDATVGVQLRVVGSATVLGNRLSVAQDATVSNVLSVGARVISVDGTFTGNAEVDGRLGVGQSNPIAKVQVTSGLGYGGANGPHSDTQVMIDRDGNAGLQIMSPAANYGVVYFGDPSGNQQGRLVYNHNNDYLYLYSANALGFVSDSSQRILLNGLTDSATANAAADDLVIGSLTGAHGMTITSAPGTVSTLAFSQSAALSNQGRIEYDHNDEALTVYADGTAGIRVQNNSNSHRPVVAIGLSDPETYSNSSLNELVVGDNEGNHGITIVTGASNKGVLVFSNGTSSTDTLRGRIQYSHSTDSFAFFSDATQRAILRASPAGAATAQLGVGTTSPGATVHGYTDNVSYPIAVLGETNVAGSTAVRGKLADSSSGNVFEGYRGENRVFRVDSQGAVFGSAYYTVSPADFAEWCLVQDDLDDYPVGTVVQQSDEELVVEVAHDPESVYGVVTDRAVFCGGLTGEDIGDDLTPEQIEQEFGAKRIAMVGHVQLRVIGPVKIGQRLTMSETPGVARAAATDNEKVFAFAIARAAFTPDEGDEIGLIEVRLL